MITKVRLINKATNKICYIVYYFSIFELFTTWLNKKKELNTPKYEKSFVSKKTIVKAT